MKELSCLPVYYLRGQIGICSLLAVTGLRHEWDIRLQIDNPWNVLGAAWKRTYASLIPHVNFFSPLRIARRPHYSSFP